MAATEHENEELARRFHDEVWDERNLDYIHEVVAEDFVGHDPSLPEPVEGPEGVRETAELFQAAFPDASVEIEQLVAADDRLVIYRTLRGTHKRVFMGIEPTGREVEVVGMALYRLEDGQIAEEWQVMDMFGLLVQLGVVEPPAG